MVFPTGQQIISAIGEAVPKIRGVPIVANIERILQRGTDFVRGNPIVSTASIGAGVTGLVAAAAIIAKRRKAPKKKAKRKKAPKKKKRKKRVKRRAPKKRRRKGKRRIIRGRGLGSHEIRHSGRSTKGKFKVVSFRDKRTGKMVRFKARR